MQEGQEQKGSGELEDQNFSSSPCRKFTGRGRKFFFALAQFLIHTTIQCPGKSRIRLKKKQKRT